MRGIERDFEAFAFGEAVTSHPLIKLHLLGLRRSAERAADESVEHFTDGGLYFVRR